MKKNILIIGSGGREHALGWKLKQSPDAGKIFFAPGNAGTGLIGRNIQIKALEITGLLDFAKNNNIHLTVVGPEGPLASGIVDLFEKHGLMIFGPSKKAARLESSKAWSASFMEKYDIPHPRTYRFTDYKKACKFFNNHKADDFVIKASGLALGKGVILPRSETEALEALETIMVKKEFGNAGDEIVIQEKIDGPEVSVMALSDGDTIVQLLSAQDHKRIFDNDQGPNTGGMGAYAPVPFMDKRLIAEIQNKILQKTIDGMKRENAPYKGILYAGLMITKNGPQVLEYNVRFGDPEMQPIAMLLKSDLYRLIAASIKGKLYKEEVTFHKGSAVCVVLASKGYPGQYERGQTIHGLSQPNNKSTVIFHAGTVAGIDGILTNGGRVLGIAAKGNNMKIAIKRAYSRIGKKTVYFAGMQFRKDIGKKGIISK